MCSSDLSHPDPSLSTQPSQAQPKLNATPYPPPIVTPVVALVLPNYLFPQMGQLGQMGAAPNEPAYTSHQPFPTPPTYPTQQPSSPPPAAYTPQAPFLPSHTPAPSQHPFYTPPLYATSHPTPTTHPAASHNHPAQRTQAKTPIYTPQNPQLKHHPH